MTANKEWDEELKKAVDTEYSYCLAKRMEEPRTNPVLGYRTAGSKAEWETGELLFQEMKRLGLTDVHKDKVKVDSWDFHHAKMRYQDRQGTVHEFELGAYQTCFETEGLKEFPIVYLGKGTADSYENIDVKGKLVLVDINQREEWWINFPVYQAHLKGAAALIAVQDQGYGEIHETALNAQDIAGPKEAAAFSISQADAEVIKEDLRVSGKQETKVLFDARSQVELDRETYNIVGTIPGQEEDSMILLSAHYDSYFSGFQDDNAAVAMMLGIARALLQIGYKPRKTLVFCALAAEEWGVVDSKYDWSTGAYEQVFTAHPEWQGKVFLDLNFELPAHAHGTRDAVRCTYEYVDFLEQFVKGIQMEPGIYPDGIEVLAPIQTWSDDFSMAISGIPSLVNEFSAGEFMETHYHSQFDNENYYEEPVYRFHHELYGKLVLALDQTAVVPLDFSRLFKAVRESVDVDLCQKTGEDAGVLFQKLQEAEEVSQCLYKKIQETNRLYQTFLEQGEKEKAGALAKECLPWNRALLHIFRKEQDYFVRLNWHDEVLFPQEAVQNNLRAIYKALACLEKKDIRGGLDAVYEIDNNRYAFLFDREVFSYFTEYVLNQPADRLKWGAGRIVHHENLFELVSDLKKRLKEENQGKTFEIQNEYERLFGVAKNQEKCLRDDLAYMTSSVDKLLAAMKACL